MAVAPVGNCLNNFILHGTTLLVTQLEQLINHRHSAVVSTFQHNSLHHQSAAAVYNSYDHTLWPITNNIHI